MKKRIVPLLMVGWAPFFLGGCLSIDLTRLPDPAAMPEKGSVEVRVFERGPDQSRGTTTQRHVVTELLWREKAGLRPVHEATDSNWTLSDLEPGDYVLRVSHWIDDEGQVRKLRSSEEEGFQLRPGKRIRADVILNDKGGLSAGVLSAIFGGLAIAGVASIFHSTDINVREDSAPRRPHPAPTPSSGHERDP